MELSLPDAVGGAGASDPYIIHPLEPQPQDDVDVEDDNDILSYAPSNSTDKSADRKEGRAVLVARAPRTVQDPHIWHLSQDSMGLYDPSGERNRWAGKTSDSKAGKEWKFHYDNDASTDQFVYVVGEEGYWRNHEVSCDPPARPPASSRDPRCERDSTAHKATFPGVSRANYRHGTACRD